MVEMTKQPALFDMDSQRYKRRPRRKEDLSAKIKALVDFYKPIRRQPECEAKK